MAGKANLRSECQAQAMWGSEHDSSLEATYERCLRLGPRE